MVHCQIVYTVRAYHQVQAQSHLVIHPLSSLRPCSSPDLNPAGSRVSFFSVMIGTFIASLQKLGTAQTSVQRYSALKSLKDAQM